MEPLDLSGELRRPTGQLPRELQRRLICLAVGDGERDRGRSGRDVQDRAVVVVGVQERPPVLPYVQVDAGERSAAGPHAATSLVSGPGTRPRPGARIPVALSE